MKIRYINLLLCALVVPAAAQTSAMTRIVMGSTFMSDSGNTLKLTAFNASVKADKCTSNSTVQDIRTNYITRSTTEYTAVPKDGDTLCTNGNWQGIGQDGQRFSGRSRTDLFIKNGAYFTSPK